MSKPTLTIAVRCPTCGGTGEGKITRSNVPYGNSGNGTFIWHGPLPKCPDCTDGTIRQAVSCAGCKYYFVSNEPSDPTYYGWCDHPDMKAMDVLPTWGCLSWEAKA